MDLVIVILSEGSQRKRNTQNLKRNDTSGLIYKTETELTVTRGKECRERINWEFGIDIYTLICIK